MGMAPLQKRAPAMESGAGLRAASEYQLLSKQSASRATRNAVAMGMGPLHRRACSELICYIGYRGETGVDT
jgi:hypothetical protein